MRLIPRDQHQHGVSRAPAKAACGSRPSPQPQEVVQVEAPHAFVFHHANAHESPGGQSIVVDSIAYACFPGFFEVRPSSASALPACVSSGPGHRLWPGPHAAMGPFGGCNTLNHTPGSSQHLACIPHSSHARLCRVHGDGSQPAQRSRRWAAILGHCSERDPCSCRIATSARRLAPASHTAPKPVLAVSNRSAPALSAPHCAASASLSSSMREQQPTARNHVPPTSMPAG